MSTSASKTTHHVFELTDAAPSGSTPDVLGLWTKRPQKPKRSFAAGSPAKAGRPEWRANLPADPKTAAEGLASGQASLVASQDALAAAEQQLYRFVDSAKRASKAGAGFGVTSFAEGPEAELLEMLSQLRSSQVSFGLGEVLGSNWQQAIQEFQDFLKQLVQHIAYYAWVETRIEGALRGLTAVTWLGDFDTAFQNGLSPEQVVLHQQTLILALKARARLMQTFIVVARGAAELAKLAVLASTPGGALLALPAALRFIQLALDEYRKQRENTHP